VSPFLHVLNEMVDQKDMDERVKKAEAARETRTLKKAVVLAGVVGATGALLLLSVRWLLGPEGTRRESVKPRSAKTRADEEVVRRLLTADEIHIDAERGLIDSAALPEVSRWNADVRSAILTRAELSKLGEVFPSWKIRQMTWPSQEQVRSHAADVSEYVRASCVKWLTKFLRDDYLPADLKEHLAPMEQWGLVRGDIVQQDGRLCDVFIVRFEKEPYVLHIQDSHANVVIAVEDTTPGGAAVAEHEELVIRTAKAILREALIPGHPPPIVRKYKKRGRVVTRLIWNPPSVVVSVGPGYRRTIRGVEVQKVGTSLLRAETDGRFVRFDIAKDSGAADDLDPYEKRFSPTE